MNNVAIITLNWKDADTTIACLQSLMRQDHPYFQVFILDNGSHDGSVEKIEKWGIAGPGENFVSLTIEEAKDTIPTQKIVLLKSNENLGFAGGNNLVMRMAIESGFQYIWLINNDTVQAENALSALIGAAESNIKAGMVTSKVLYFSKPEVIESMGSKLFIPLGIFRHIGQGMKASEAPSVPFEVPLVYGCSFIIKEELIKDTGFMDERFFLLIEEGDWCIRARKKGWKILSAPASAVWHKVSRSIGKRSDIFFYYVTRNTLLFMKKHYPVFLPLTVLAMFPLVSGLIVADSLFSERKNSARRLKMVLLGYLHFLQGRFGKLMEANR